MYFNLYLCFNLNLNDMVKSESFYMNPIIMSLETLQNLKGRNDYIVCMVHAFWFWQFLNLHYITQV